MNHPGPEEGKEVRMRCIEQNKTIIAITGCKRRSDADKVHELCAYIRRKHADFNHVNIATAMHRLATTARQGGRGASPAAAEAVAVLVSRAQEVMGDFVPHGLANILWAFATLGETPPSALLLGIQERSLELLRGESRGQEFTSQNIGNTLWAHATLGVQPDETLVQLLLGRAVACMHEFKAQEIGNLTWALATIGIQMPAELQVAVADQAERVAGSFTAQNIANTIWGFGVLCVAPDDKMLRALSDAAVALVNAGERGGEFTCQNIANILYALASLKVKPAGNLIRALTHQAVKQQAHFKPQELANILWAWATLDLEVQFPDSGMLPKMEARALRLADEFNAADVAITVWALATMRRAPAEELREALSVNAARLVHTFKAQDVSNYLWGLATLGLEPAPAVWARLMAHIDVVVGHMLTQHVSNSMWAIGQLGLDASARAQLDPPQAQAVNKVTGALSSAVLARQPAELLPEQSAILCWSCVVLDLVDGALLGHLLHSIRVNMPQMDESGLRQTHQVLLSLKYDTQLTSVAASDLEPLEEAAGAACRAAFGRANAQEKLNTSRIQADVAAHMRSMGLQFVEEWVDDASGYSVDIFLGTAAFIDDVARDKFPMGCAVEVDGPYHFLAKSKRPLGHTLLKRRHLRQMGFLVVPVPYWEWDAFSNENEAIRVDKTDYLRSLLSGYIALPAVDLGNAEAVTNA